MGWKLLTFQRFHGGGWSRIKGWVKLATTNGTRMYPLRNSQPVTRGGLEDHIFRFQPGGIWQCDACWLPPALLMNENLRIFRPKTIYLNNPASTWFGRMVINKNNNSSSTTIATTVRSLFQASASLMQLPVKRLRVPRWRRSWTISIRNIVTRCQTPVIMSQVEVISRWWRASNIFGIFTPNLGEMIH